MLSWEHRGQWWVCPRACCIHLELGKSRGLGAPFEERGLPVSRDAFRLSGWFDSGARCRISSRISGGRHVIRCGEHAGTAGMVGQCGVNLGGRG